MKGDTVNSVLRAGAAQVDITPKLGTHLSGAIGAFRPAGEVADPLYARAMVLEHDGRKLCVLSLDVTIITKEYSLRIRRAAQELGFDSEAVVVHAVQNHSAPSIGDFMLDPDFPGIPHEYSWLRGSDEDYNDYAAERAIDAIRQANASLRPVQVGSGSGVEGRMAFNRRAVAKDGTVFMPGKCWDPQGTPRIHYIEGPIDPELGVMCIQDESTNVVSMLLHYTCHPVHVFPSLTVSADWPGAWASEMTQHHGAQCVPLIVNGACGNINPWDHFNPDYTNDHKLMGRVLAETAEKVIGGLTFTSDCALDWEVRHVPIPIRHVDPEKLEWARRILSEYPEPVWTNDSRTQTDWNWIMAAQLWSVHLCRQREPQLDYEIQVLRVGDTAIVGLPGEPFVEGQLHIKMASPARSTFVAHCSTQYVGYLPTSDAFARGGHEVNTSYWSKLVPEALDMVVNGTTETLRELFKP